MYVEITRNLEVNLMGMDFIEAEELRKMIRGAGLEQRRTFNRVLQQLEKPIDELMK